MAASLAVTTPALVVAYMAGKSGAAALNRFDASKLQGLIDTVSMAVESYTHRRLLQTARVEQMNVRRGQSILAMDAYPMLAAAAPTPLLEIREAQDRKFTSSSTVISNLDYYADLKSGTFLLDGKFRGGAGSVQVSWTGGLATTQGNLATNYPDIVEAANLWVNELWDRRDTHSRSQSDGGPGRGKGGSDPLLSLANPPPFVASVLGQYRASRMTRV